ncbi:MAG: HNH endonuclease [Mesorhizobium sp.]|uniref:HNH endonuclease n=1 Tax=Mesorhizobium sp. TaxID=1871066 RepID=UPI000FE64453|nr:HNH endonuclease [Mesorhizobium sp.]RWK85303.1 MAG: HNH endonuclease [Mesorhizobium sp.]
MAINDSGLPALDVIIPEWDEPSHPFSRGQTPKLYTPATLGDHALGKTKRTDFFEKVFAGLYWKLNGPVPYAFLTKDGNVRSMDAGCIKFLDNRGPGHIEFHLDPNGFIVAATPGEKLLSTLEPIRARLIEQVSPGGASLLADLPFSLTDVVDERRRIESIAVIRDGQAEFRKKVLSVWGRCAITRSRTAAVMEAAHLYRYLGPKTNDIRNGIALRTDLHVLFDKQLVGLKPMEKSLMVVVSTRLAGSEYASLNGRDIALPVDVSCRPDATVLRYRFAEFEAAETTRAGP